MSPLILSTPLCVWFFLILNKFHSTATELHWKTSDTYELDNWDIVYTKTRSNTRKNRENGSIAKTSTELCQEYVSDRLVVINITPIWAYFSKTFLGKYWKKNYDLFVKLNESLWEFVLFSFFSFWQFWTSGLFNN